MVAYGAGKEEIGRAPRTGVRRRAGLEWRPAERPAGSSESRRPRRPRRKRKAKRSGHGAQTLVGRAVAYWALVLGLWLVIGGVGTVAYVGAHLPPIQSLEIPKRPPSIQIVDDGGRVLALRGDAGGAVLTLKELPSYVPKAFVAIEDRRFYEHFGIDPFGIGRALRRQHPAPRHQPGRLHHHAATREESVLTQERTVHRKLQEALLAVWLERKFSKTQILELYLNRVYFGAGAYGIEQAAQRYFGKPARADDAARSGLARRTGEIAVASCTDAQFRRRRAARAKSCSPPWQILASSAQTSAKDALAQARRQSSRRPAPARSIMSPTG